MPFALIHLGLLLIIGGASAGHFLQVEGYMWIEQNSASNRVEDYQKTGKDRGKLKLVEELPFSVALDKFWIQYYSIDENPRLFIEVYNAETPQPGFMPVSESQPKEASVKGLSLKVEEVLLHADADIEIVEESRLVVELKKSKEKKSYPVIIGEKIQPEGLTATFIPKKVFRNARVSEGVGLVESNDPHINPAIQLIVEEAGQDPQMAVLFSNMPNFHKTITDTDSYRLLYTHPVFTSSKVTQRPSNDGGLCAVKIEASLEGQLDSRWCFLNSRDLPNSYSPFEGFTIALYHDVMVKDFKSKLSIIEDDEMTTSKVIEVNYPLSYNGYVFYQADYDKEQGSYTVLQVVKDPGVWWVMAGFVVIMLGLIQKFYLDPLSSRKNRKEVEND